MDKFLECFTENGVFFQVAKHNSNWISFEGTQNRTGAIFVYSKNPEKIFENKEKLIELWHSLYLLYEPIAKDWFTGEPLKEFSFVYGSHKEPKIRETIDRFFEA